MWNKGGNNRAINYFLHACRGCHKAKCPSETKYSPPLSSEPILWLVYGGCGGVARRFTSCPSEKCAWPRIL